MDIAKHKGCGGAIGIAKEHDGTAYLYCDKCGAFTMDADAELPTGSDRDANRAAWDNAEDRSPDAEEGDADA
jgi:hypothetical protein